MLTPLGLQRTRDDAALKARVYKIGFVFGLVALPLFIVFTVMTLAFPEPPLAPENVTLLSGIAERVILPGEERGNNDLRLTLSGEPLVLKLLSMYMHPSVPAKTASIVPGETAIEVGVPTAQMAKPPRNHLTQTDFREICSLALDGETIYTLDDYNRAGEANNALGRIVAPALLGVDLLLVVATAFLVFGKKRRDRA